MCIRDRLGLAHFHSELNRRLVQHVAFGGGRLHEAVASHRQIMHLDDSLIVRGERVEAVDHGPRPVGQTLLQLEHRSGKHRRRIVGIHRCV